MKSCAKTSISLISRYALIVMLITAISIPYSVLAGGADTSRDRYLLLDSRIIVKIMMRRFEF